MKYMNHIANPIICITASEKFRNEAKYIICCGNVDQDLTKDENPDGDLNAYRESKRLSVVNPNLPNGGIGRPSLVPPGGAPSAGSFGRPSVDYSRRFSAMSGARPTANAVSTTETSTSEEKKTLLNK